MESIAKSRSIAAASLVREVISSYPNTGSIFLQHGQMFRTSKGNLYVSYDPPLTVGDYAILNGVELGPLLRLLNAAAESEEAAPKPAGGCQMPGGHVQRDDTRRAHETDTAGDPGYTGSYREMRDVESVPFVASLLEKGGPE